MALRKSTNITFHPGLITKDERERFVGHKGCTIWFTGLSASGKSTIASALEQVLLNNGVFSYRLDGDNVRHGLNQNLGFSPEDRDENIRRISEVAKLFADACAVAVTAFISPYRQARDMARQIHEKEGIAFIEVYVDCSLEEAEKRDPKGLYKMAREGKIKDFTGIDAPYEPPLNPELTLNTTELSVVQCVDEVISYLKNRGLWKRSCASTPSNTSA